MHVLAFMMGWLLAAAPDASWPGFRGQGNSLTVASQLPLTWSEQENVAWKADLSGYGQSSPVVWRDRVFVTSSEGPEKERQFIDCFELETGKRLWQHQLPASQKVTVSNYVSRAAPTPVVDGQAVYAFFESGDLAAIDHAGKMLWNRSLTAEYGKFEGNHGLGGSPTQTAGAVILLIDHSGPSYLLAVDKRNGANLWKTNREPRVSWTSPLVIEDRGPQQAIVTSNGVVQSFAMADGRRLWELDGVQGNTVASATQAGNLVLIGSSEPGQSCALRLSAEGAEEKPSIAWRPDDTTCSFASPLVLGDHAYFVAKGGILKCVALADGQVRYTHRLPESCWASPLGAGDRVYFFTTGGTTLVLRAGPEMQELARNELPTADKVYGVAAVDNALLIRTGTTLTKIQDRRSK